MFNRRSSSRTLHGAAVVVLLLLAAAPAWAGPVFGFRETWPGTSVQNWGGGSLTYVNPGTGGADGAEDGFLRVANDSPFKLGAHSVGVEYAGDWRAAHIGRVRFKLNNLAADEALQIHFCIGNQSNFWQYDAAFLPTASAWTLHEVDLSSSTGWTQIIGTDSFENALKFCDRILIRHDLPPFVQTPNDVAGDFGLDDLELLGDETPTREWTWGRIKSLYR